jgi:hypothetical protein
MRWRQVYNEEKGKYELVPITDSSRAKASSADIHGDIEPFLLLMAVLFLIASS